MAISGLPPAGGAGAPSPRAFNAAATASLIEVCKDYNHANLHKEVSNALKAGADPNAQDETGIPVLFHATCRLDVAVVEDLLSHGADPQAIAPLGGVSVDLMSFVISRRLNTLFYNHQAIFPQMSEIEKAQIVVESAHIEQLLRVLQGAGYDFNKSINITPSSLFPEGSLTAFESVITHIADRSTKWRGGSIEPFLPLLTPFIERGARVHTENFNRIFFRPTEVSQWEQDHGTQPSYPLRMAIVHFLERLGIQRPPQAH